MGAMFERGGKLKSSGEVGEEVRYLYRKMIPAPANTLPARPYLANVYYVVNLF